MAKKSRRSNKSRIYAALAVVVLIVIAGGLYYHFHNNDNPNNLINTAGSKVIKAHKSEPTSPQLPTSTAPTNSGGVVDTNGQTSGVLPNSSLWVASNNGDITLQEPSPSTTIQSGDSIVGLAKVNTVQFILTDNSVGLIAQGNLTVVNGKFSGKLEFTPHSSSGTLQVYYPNPNNGAEEDIVEINVNFAS